MWQDESLEGESIVRWAGDANPASATRSPVRPPCCYGRYSGFLSYLHPVKPPSVYPMTDDHGLPTECMNADGSVDLYQGNRHWDANRLMAADVIGWLEEVLDARRSMPTTQSDDGGAEQQEG